MLCACAANEKLLLSADSASRVENRAPDSTGDADNIVRRDLNLGIIHRVLIGSKQWSFGKGVTARGEIYEKFNRQKAGVLDGGGGSDVPVIRLLEQLPSGRLQPQQH